MNGKGSKRRPLLIDRPDFDKSWDATFNPKPPKKYVSDIPDSELEVWHQRFFDPEFNK